MKMIDDKSEHCIPFITRCLDEHRDAALKAGSEPKPFFVGLQGVQGSGKTTLVEALYEKLSSPPHSLRCVVLSIDDLYLTHEDQLALARAHPDNPLVQHRGQPSTHDIELGRRLFKALTEQEPTRLPSYDKSAFSGVGDRKPVHDWSSINGGEKPVEVIIFEGWCVGFRALNEQDLKQKWEIARQSYEDGPDNYNGQLGKVKLEDVKLVNDALKSYDVLTDQFGCFVQIEAEDTHWVYDWRLEQEVALRASKGTGMSDDQVHHFVDGYYPAYELYSDVLRGGIFKDEGKQLLLTVNKGRKVVKVETL